MYLFHIFSFIFGALIGSFLNVVILRLPDPEASIVLPASHCPFCRAPIRWFDNIPILSFLLLGRRCRACKATISWQYPLVELAMATLSLALFQRYLISIAFAGYFLFTAALLVIIFIDLRHQIIPDVISLPGMAIGLGFALCNPDVTWRNSAIGLVAGGGILYVVALGYYLVTRKEGMGGGDIKLLAMIGAWLGWQSLPFVIFSSSLIGSLAGIGAMVKQKKGGKTIIPYGPFLSMSALLYLFFREEILFCMRYMHWLP